MSSPTSVAAGTGRRRSLLNAPSTSSHGTRRNSMIRRPSMAAAPASASFADSPTKPLRSSNANRIRAVLLCSSTNPFVHLDLAAPSPSSMSSGTPAIVVTCMGASVLAAKSPSRLRCEIDTAVPPQSAASPKEVDDIVSEVLDGMNGSLIGFSTTQGRSCVFSDAGAPVSQSIVFHVISEILEAVESTRSLSRSSSYEVLLSVVALHDGRVADLLAAPVGDTATGDDKGAAGVAFQRASVLVHPIVCPRIMGTELRTVKNRFDLERWLTAATTAFHNHCAHATIAAMLLVKHTLAAPPEVSSNAAHTQETTLCSLLALDVGERLSLMNKALSDPAPTHDATLQLLHFALRGNTISVAFCGLGDGDDAASVHDAVSILGKVSALSTPERRRGDVREVAAELRAQMAAINARLEGAASDSASKKRLERELVTKELQLRELDELLTRGAATSTLQQELQRAFQLQRVNQQETQEALEQLTKEKCRQFAQVFRIAFQNKARSDDSNRRAAVAARELEETLQALARQREANASLERELTQTRRTLSNLKDEAEVGRKERVELEAQLSKLRQHCGTLELQKENLQRRQQQQQRPGASGESPSDSAASTAIRLAHAAVAQIESQALLAKCRSELDDAKMECDKLRARCEEIAREAKGEFERQESLTQSENVALSERLRLTTDANRELEFKLQQTQEAFVALQQKHLDEVRKNVFLEQQLRERERSIRAAHSVENDAYLNFLYEGQCLLDELQHFYAMQLSETPSAYRGDKQSVLVWLQRLGGLDHLASMLAQHGFDTMHTVSTLTDEDLSRMGVLPGTRRKLLQGVSELQAAYRSAVAKSLALFRDPVTLNESQYSDGGSAHGSGGEGVVTSSNEAICAHFNSPLALQSLLHDLNTWLNDFQCCVEADRSRGGGGESPRLQ